jgi:hypothetical protein
MSNGVCCLGQATTAFVILSEAKDLCKFCRVPGKLQRSFASLRMTGKS